MADSQGDDTVMTIPAPPAWPVIGNLHQIPKAGLIGHLLDVSEDFVDPGIFKLRFGPRVGIFVTHPDLVAELCDETRFRKIPGPGLRVVRKFAGDGLFTAFSEEANWGRAHRILLPAFSQRSMRGYFDLILEVCDQLIAKWTKADGQELLIADDMTRLTLDSIAIAGFGHRFNSFARDDLDPFLESLARALGDELRELFLAQRLGWRMRVDPTPHGRERAVHDKRAHQRQRRVGGDLHAQHHTPAGQGRGLGRHRRRRR